ncbi:MAG: DUF2924 domain-containing protein [Hyphomicrobium sp.]|nr:DUF2924 domain-containing protein [Hyphomicrobium sp.]
MPTMDVSGTTCSVSAHERAESKSIEAELAALGNMNAPNLRKEWARLNRSHPPKKLSRKLLQLGVAWKLQERAFGGLSAVTKRQIADLAQAMEAKVDLTRARTVRLRQGARLIREWDGETHEVLVVADGFQWRGRTWRSLSVIAREMTGTHWSGPRFFGINQSKAVGSIRDGDE